MACSRSEASAGKGGVGLFAAYTFDASERDVDVHTEEAIRILDGRDAQRTYEMDTYRMRGLTPDVDYLVRIHAPSLTTAQDILQEFQETSFGGHSTLTNVFVGRVRDAVYLSQMPELAEREEKATFEGKEPPDYGIVIPVKKHAEWWNLDESDRLDKMRDHIDVSMPYLDRVRRQLYHSSGFTDFDYITYFETSDLDAFTDLYRDLESIPEYRYLTYGNPTLIGCIESPETVISTLCPN